MKKSRDIILGIIVIAVGIIWGLNSLEITNINIFFDGWWTVFIIAPCAYSLFTGSDKIGSLLGIAVGVLLFLASQEIFSFAVVWKAAVPLVIIAIGIKIIAKSLFSKAKYNISSPKGEIKYHSVIFSGSDIKHPPEKFSGGVLSAVFGGIDYNLRDAIITENIYINATAVFGGIEIFLPENVNYKVSSTSIFGGIDQKKKKTDLQNDVPTVYINATCIFGGMDIL